jgi:hypothetical protein
VVDLLVGKTKERFIVEIKNKLRANRLPAIRKQQEAVKEPFLLICLYIPTPLKRELKDLHINYLEAAGNRFVHTDNVFFFINDRHVTPARLPVEGKLWKAAGLKLLFALLRYPKLLHAPYRQIADEAGIALGNVGGYLEELQKEGFLRDGKINLPTGVFIDNKQRLIERWAEAYQTNLRPKEWVNNFRFMNPAHQKDWRNLPTERSKWRVRTQLRF